MEENKTNVVAEDPSTNENSEVEVIDILENNNDDFDALDFYSEDNEEKDEEKEEASEIIEKNIPSDLKLKAEVGKEFSYLNYHADGLFRVKNSSLVSSTYSLIKYIQILNNQEEIATSLIVFFSFSSNILKADDIVLPPLSIKDGFVRLPFLKVNKNELDVLKEATPCELVISLINSNTNEVLDSLAFQFTILPIAQPTSDINADLRLYAKYVTPLDSYVKQITNKAVLLNDGNPLIGYQNINKDDMVKEVLAIYEAALEIGINYQNPPANSFKTQRIRLASEVIKDKKGTCLDLAILLCSCLLEVGYHPFLICYETHATLGVFLKEKLHFENGITSKISEITNLLATGKEDAIIIEATYLCDNTPFADALNKGKNYLFTYEKGSFDAIDIHSCHQGGIYLPLPLSGEDFELETLIKPKEIEEKDLNPIINYEFENVAKEEKLDRFKIWERKLLDLSEKNRLVDFTISKSTVLRIVAKEELTSLLANDDSYPLAMSELSGVKDVEEALTLNGDIKDELILNEEHTLYALGLEHTLKSLVKKAHDALEETGASPLHLCLGMLKYKSPKTGKLLKAPFCLLPVQIKKDGAKYKISYDGGDLKINQTFFEYYAISHPDSSYKSIYEFNDLSKYYDACDTFIKMCVDDISLDASLFYLANLSFSNQVMWLDIVKRKEELKKNVIIQSFNENRSLLENDIIKDDESIEELEKYQDFAAPLTYDSSQLKAILDCGKGKSFILDGPPGTGKSQTIVNMIINAFYNNKKVLFVAEKKAALDVVYDRLSKLKLGRYCLELHSNKATKGEFFNKLGEVMEFGTSKEPNDYQARCEELTNRKNILKAKINQMHSHHEYFYSMYDCIIDLKKYDYLVKDKVNFDDDFLKDLNEASYSHIIQLLDSYTSICKNIPSYNTNPIKIIGLDTLHFINDKEMVLNDFKESKEAISEYLKNSNNFFNLIPFNYAKNETNYNLLFEIFDLAYYQDLYQGSLFDLYSSNKESIQNTINNMQKLASELASFNEKVDIEKLVSEKNIDEYLTKLKNAKGFISHSLATKSILKELSPYFNEKTKLNEEELAKFLLDVASYLKEKEDLDVTSNEFINVCKQKPSVAFKDLDNVLKTYDNTLNFINKINEFGKDGDLQLAFNYFLNIAINKDEIAKMNYQFALLSYQKYLKTMALLKDKYHFNLKALNPNNSDYFEKLIDCLSYASEESHFTELLDNASLNKLKKGLATLGVTSLLEKVENSSILYEDIYDLLTVSLAYGYLALYFRKEEINNFVPSLMNDEIISYQKAIEEYSAITVSEVSYRISSHFARNDVNYSTSSAIGTLKKAISNSGRGLSIRGALSEFKDIILNYFPCFLMSPLSAAQYLAVGEDNAFDKFDIVIFDEASQIPTHEAIGPIARGKSLIVAGDPKQMPPSPYFSCGIELSDEDVLFDDATSLLDECLAIDMPRHRLTYHYRSKHESLIEFSNQEFYGNSLYTFPSSNTSTSCIEFIKVDVNNKADSAISKAELDTITSTFRKVYEDPATFNKSIGIICFNMKQSDKILEAINKMLLADANLLEQVKKAEAKTREPYFVKSIENVQGDERDIILLSIGFALNKDGTPAIKGPLIAGDNNGQRRLNVVASRSKEKMIVISTISYTQFLDDSRIKNPGALCLKKFLNFVEHASFNANKENYCSEDNILYYLKQDLEERGLQVNINVGNSEFRVDLAIYDKDKTHYELGVLIDTSLVSDKITCRDKFFVQEAILNANKWKIIHIYSLEYFKNKDATIDKIINALDEKYVKEENIIEINIEKEDSVKPIYQIVENPSLDKLPSIFYSQEKGFSSNIATFISQLIVAMSPISQNEIINYVTEYCSLKSLNELALKRLKMILNKYFVDYAIYDQSQYFYYKNKEMDMVSFRLANNRDIYDIAKEEIICAMKQIITLQGKMEEVDLYKETLKAFNLASSLTLKNKDRLEFVYRYAIKNNKL